jgi:hypothetical protein
MTFERVDFLYTPSHDVAEEAQYFVDVLGGRLVFAIEDGGTRVAMVEQTDESPRILLTATRSVASHCQPGFAR